MKCGSYESPGGEFFDNYLEASMHLDHFGTAVRAGYDTILAADTVQRQLLELRAKLGAKSPAGASLDGKTPSFGENVLRFVMSEAASGYQFMQQVILVRLASVLESGVEAMCRHVEAFLAQSNAAPAPAVARSRKQRRRERTTPIKRYDARLVNVGLNGTSDSLVDDEVKHLIELRNVIVHRDGIADEALIQAAPAGAHELGMSVRFDGESLHRFITAVRWYLFDLMVRWDALYRQTNPTAQSTDAAELLDFRDKLLSHLKDLVASKETAPEREAVSTS